MPCGLENAHYFIICTLLSVSACVAVPRLLLLRKVTLTPTSRLVAIYGCMCTESATAYFQKDQCVRGRFRKPVLLGIKDAVVQRVVLSCYDGYTSN